MHDDGKASCSVWPMSTMIPSRQGNVGLTRKETLWIRDARQYGSPGSKLCFGTTTFGDGRGIFKGISAVGQGGADELVKTSIDVGINFFDTADNYTVRLSEKFLGQWLKTLNIVRKDVVIATKVYSRIGRGRKEIPTDICSVRPRIRSVTRRAMTSVAPPATNGTIIVMGRVG
jgi:aryl-alcohol dehydrogenase-like predicted oxidoreductase